MAKGDHPTGASHPTGGHTSDRGSHQAGITSKREVTSDGNQLIYDEDAPFHNSHKELDTMSLRIVTKIGSDFDKFVGNISLASYIEA